MPNRGGLRRLGPLDSGLIVTLAAVWLVAFALHLRQVVTGRLAWVPVFVSGPGAGERYPTLKGVWSGSEGALHGLSSGDRLLRVGAASLEGVGPIGFVARVYAQAGSDLAVPVEFERAGVVGEGTLALAPVGHPWRIAPVVTAMAVTGVLVFLRVPRAPVGRAFFLGAMAYAIHWSLFPGRTVAQTWAWTAVFALTSAVLLPLYLRPALLFPQDIAPRDGRLPWWPWAFALLGPMTMSWVFGVPFPHAVGQLGALTINVAFIATYLWVLTRSYRRSGPVGRRQLKWVVYGFYVGLVPVFAGDAIAALEPSWWWLHEATTISLVAIPICLVIALSRYDLFDINRLISLTASYTILSLILVAGVLTVIPRLGVAVSASTGSEAGTVQLGLSLMLAGGLVLGGRNLRSHAERIFFPERHRLEMGFEQLLLELSSCATPTALLTLAGERLAALLRPDLCRIYAASEAGYGLVFRAGAESAAGDRAPVVSPVAPHAGEVDPSALASLHGLQAPIDVTRELGKGGTGLIPSVRAVFESLGVAVVVPVSRGGSAAALIVLGAKRSEDVYTPTDLALLRALADTLSGALLRFADAETLRQERAVQAALREYLPDPLVALLTRGREIEGGEREVAVLFVDLRSFTTYSERHGTPTVVSVVNRYTRAVSAIINGHGGTVLEFLGDGLMAVFGAPEALPAQARSAVECACEIVGAVRALELAGPGEAPIAVGIGITTGIAFVGNVQAADRLIYTALGDIVNLASRLQGLTRNLEAAIAVDAATHDAAGDAAGAFRRHGPALVRGRDHAVDVYYLPLESAEPPLHQRAPLTVPQGPDRAPSARP